MRDEVKELIGKKVRITRRRSVIRYNGKQKDTIYALGLRKINASRELVVSQNIAGMIERVRHVIDVEVVAD